MNIRNRISLLEGEKPPKRKQRVVNRRFTEQVIGDPDSYRFEGEILTLGEVKKRLKKNDLLVQVDFPQETHDEQKTRYNN